MDTQNSIYEQLLLQPLFQGLGKSDITEIIERVKMDFRTYPADTIIYEENQPCQELMFLLNGRYSQSHKSQNNLITFTEICSFPSLPIGLESLFGYVQNHNQTYRSITELQVVAISKKHIIKHLMPYEVFRFNLMGILCTKLQRSYRQLWKTPQDDLLKRFVMMCENQFTQPYGEKQIKGTMNDLTGYFQVTRLNLSNMLNQIANEGLIALNRKSILIPNFEKLVEYMRNKDVATTQNN